MWFKTEEKNEEDNQDIQTLINKTVKETLAQFQQGNLNTYSNQAEKKTYKKYNSRKWVSATEVAKITGLKDVKWARELMVKGYFGQVRKWGKNRNKVLREVVENTELAGRGNPIEYPNVKPLKTNSLSSEGTKDRIKTKWINAREVAEIKGLKVQWARELMHKSYFGKTIGKTTRHSPLKVLREVVENTELVGQGRPNVNRPFPSDKRNYTGRPKVNKKPKSKWIIAREVSEIHGRKTSQWARSKMIKGYFGKTKGKGHAMSPLKVLREVVENTEITKRSKPKVNSSSDRPKKTKQKWVTAIEVAEMKGMGKTWAIKLMNRGYFGKTTGKGKPHSPTKVLREVVENTELIGRGFHMEDSNSSGLRAMNFNRKTKQETFKPKVNSLAYEDIKNQLMEDREFLSKVGSNVMSNLRFINKLDSE